MSFEALQQLFQVATSELPLEGTNHLFVMSWERQQALLQVLQRREVIRCEDLPLHDGKVDLDLVEPAGVNGRMDNDQVGPWSL